MNLDKFFKPRAIAVIGASRDQNKIGHVILKNLIDAGFKGKIFPVNPKADEITNLKCYSSVLDIKEDIDLAIISVSAEVSVKVVKECGIKDIPAIAMITAGFSEIGNEEGEKEILDLI